VLAIPVILDGIEAARQIADAGLPTRILILTTCGIDEYVSDAFRAGAAGFLLKTGEDPRTRILAKLDPRDRVQAAVFAYERSLIHAGQR